MGAANGSRTCSHLQLMHGETSVLYSCGLTAVAECENCVVLGLPSHPPHDFSL